MMAARPEKVARIGIFPRWYIGFLARSHLRYVLSWLTFNRKMRTAAVWDAMIGYGLIVQTIRSRKTVKAVTAQPHAGPPVQSAPPRKSRDVEHPAGVERV